MKDVSIAAITKRNLEARAKAIKAGKVIVLPNGALRLQAPSKLRLTNKQIREGGL